MDSSNSTATTGMTHTVRRSRYRSQCAVCGKIQNSQNYTRHLRLRHKLNEDMINRYISMFKCRQSQSSSVPLLQTRNIVYTSKKMFRGCYIQIMGSPINDSETLVSLIIQRNREEILRQIHCQLSSHMNYKVQFATHVKFRREVDEELQEKKWYFTNDAVQLTTNRGFLEMGATELDEKIANFTSHGSNWIVDKILALYFTFYKTVDLCRLTGR